MSVASVHKSHTITDLNVQPGVDLSVPPRGHRTRHIIQQQNLPFIIVPPTSIPQPFLKTTALKPKEEETVNPLSKSVTPHCGTHLSSLYAPPMNSSRPHEKTLTERSNAYGNKTHILPSSLNAKAL